jgi:predicted phosphate transport protein (TIGR00153 family)
MFFRGKKENKVKQTIKEHLQVVCQTVNSMMDTVESHVQGNFKEANDRAYNTHQLESKADILRREIIETLYKGAFFPAVREDLINYVAKQDKIADRAESCCDFINFTQALEM